MELVMAEAGRRRKKGGKDEKIAEAPQSLWNHYSSLHRSIYYSLKLYKSLPIPESENDGGLLASHHIARWISLFEKTEETIRSLIMLVVRSLVLLCGFTSSGNPSHILYSKGVKTLLNTVSGNSGRLSVLATLRRNFYNDWVGLF